MYITELAFKMLVTAVPALIHCSCVWVLHPANCNHRGIGRYIEEGLLSGHC